MTRYLEETFTVAPGASKAYRDNYDNIFRSKGDEVTKDTVAKDGAFLTIDGEVKLVEYRKGKEVSSEVIDGELILKLVVMVLEQELVRLKAVTPRKGKKK